MPDNENVHSRRIAIGRIRKAIGLQGICGVEAFGSTLARLTAAVPVFIGASERNVTMVTLEMVDFRSKGPACRFSGIETAEQAEAMREWYIYIDEDLLPGLDDGMYYHHDLIGLKVQDDSGTELGKVIEVHNFPSIDSVEVARGSSPEPLMIPLTADAVVSIDQATGYLTVRRSVIDELL